MRKMPALHLEDGHWRFATALLLILIGLEVAWLAPTIDANPQQWLGMDYTYYVSLGQQWLADGSFYEPHQLAGPYQAQLLGIDPTVSTLYPPTALFLFVPFSVLPAVMWWALPIAITVFAIRRLRPSPPAWAAMAVLLAWPRAIGAYLFGNTDMWIMAGVAAGLVWGWPAVLVLIKPTLAPLALVGVRSRWFWVAGLLGFAVTLPLWDDYVLAMVNQRGLDIGYSLGSLPLVCIPLVPVLLRLGWPESDGQGRGSHLDLEGADLTG